MTCTKTNLASGPCAQCRVYQFDGVHIVERSSAYYGSISDIFCAECCPVCHPKLKEWSAEPVTIQGEQEGLF